MRRKDLLGTVKSLLSVTADGGIKDQCSCFDIDNGVVRVTDCRVLIQKKTVDTGVRALVPAKPFVKILASLSGEEVDLKIRKGYLEVLSDNTEVKLSVMEFEGKTIGEQLIEKIVDRIARCKSKK